MLMPFQGCGCQILKKMIDCEEISENPERVIAFRMGQRPIKMGELFFSQF
jgi:hypothetical protein